MWRCVHCNTENPDREEVCRKCEEQRAKPVDIVGGATVKIDPRMLFKPKGPS